MGGLYELMHQSGLAAQQLNGCGRFHLLPPCPQASTRSNCGLFTRVKHGGSWGVLPKCPGTGSRSSHLKQDSIFRPISTFTVLSQPDATDQLMGREVESLDIDAVADDELDHLFEEYGEVVVASSVDRASTCDADDDSESLGCEFRPLLSEAASVAIAMAQAADEVKAGDIKVLFVKPLIYWSRFFVLATGFSKPQVGAIADKMQEVAQNFDRQPRGDLKPNAWTLLDFGDVVVHIFQPKERAYYNLEEFYGNAPCVELPFSQSVE